MLAHELHEQLKLRAIHRQLHIGCSHVVDHHNGGQTREEIPQLWQIDCFKINDHMPAQFANARGNFHELFFGGEVHQAFDKVKPNAANARVVHGLQFLVCDAALDRSNAAGFAVGVQQSIHGCAIVSAMASSAYHHVA